MYSTVSVRLEMRDWRLDGSDWGVQYANQLKFQTRLGSRARGEWFPSHDNPMHRESLCCFLLPADVGGLEIKRDGTV